MLLTDDQRLIQMKGRDATARSFANTALEADEDGRAPELLDQLGGHDPDHARMPAVGSEDDGPALLHAPFRLDSSLRLRINLGLHGLSLAIHQFPNPGQLAGACGRPGPE